MYQGRRLTPAKFGVMGSIPIRSTIPDDIVKEIGALVGTWEVTGRMGEEELEMTWSARWAPEKAYLVTRLSFEKDGKRSNHIGLIGWDPANKHVVDFHFGLDGDARECALRSFRESSP